MRPVAVVEINAGHIHAHHPGAVEVDFELMSMTDIAGSNLLGDKAYGTKEILTYIKEHRAAVVIPPKSNAKEPWEIDYFLYKERHLVECFFQKLKWFRRVATRYDKLDRSFLAFVYMAVPTA